MANGPVASGEKKKGLSPLAWVGIGCLGLMVVGGVVATVLGIFVMGKVREVASEMEEDPIAATAKWLAAANPEIELVEADKDSRTVTFRDTRTGEELTFGYDDIENGRVTFSSGGETASIELETDPAEAGALTIRNEDGTATFRAGGGAVEDLPDWVPVYPGVVPQGNFATQTGELRSGAFSFQSADGLEAVLDFYVREVEAAGLTVESRSTTPEGALLAASSSDRGRGLNLIAGVKSGTVEVVVNFNEKL